MEEIENIEIGRFHLTNQNQMRNRRTNNNWRLFIFSWKNSLENSSEEKIIEKPIEEKIIENSIEEKIIEKSIEEKIIEKK